MPSPRSTAGAEHVGRRLVASLFALGTAAVMVLPPGRPKLAVVPPVALLVLSAVLTHRRHLGSQLLSRAVWWSLLVLGTLLTGSPSAIERHIGLVMALCDGAALLSVGRLGLDDPATAGSFVPRSFRSSLLALLVMALADAQAFLVFALVDVDRLNRNVPSLSLLCAAALVVAGVGLYRLKVWGLLACVLGNATIVALIGSDYLPVPAPLSWAYFGTSALQIILAAPILATMLGAPPPQRRAPRSLGRVVGPVLAIVVLMALATHSFLLG